VVVGVSHGLDRTPIEESWQANRSPGIDRVRWINGGFPFQLLYAIAKCQDLIANVVVCTYLPFMVGAQEVPSHLVCTTGGIEAKGHPLQQEGLLTTGYVVVKSADVVVKSY